MMSIFQKAERRKAKLRLALCGPSGSGKTFSALKIAKGMGGKIALIDTENGSGQLYCDIADYDVAEIAPPFSVDKYIGAIKGAEEAGYDVLIIDSLSHAWSKQGGILDEVNKRGGKNSFTNGWRDATPLHDKFIDAILQSSIHIIVTMRAKTAYEMEKDEKGKIVPVKKGMEPVQRAGLEYEFTVVLDMDNERHTATSGKDRTRLFDGKCFTPDENTGMELMQWLGMGVDQQPQYYQPQQQQWNGGYQQQGYEQQLVQQVQYQQPQVPQQALYGFTAHESEIITAWNTAGWDPNGVVGYIQARYGKSPGQMTFEECYALMMEFNSYVQDKQGGQQ
jgi:hypothetical protein